MVDRLTKICIENRLIIIAASFVLFIIGAYVSMNMKVDVFPDLTAPTVTIMTDAHGMAPEEVEALITYPYKKAWRSHYCCCNRLCAFAHTAFLYREILFAFF